MYDFTSLELLRTLPGNRGFIDAMSSDRSGATVVSVGDGSDRGHR